MNKDLAVRRQRFGHDRGFADHAFDAGRDPAFHGPYDERCQHAHHDAEKDGDRNDEPEPHLEFGNVGVDQHHRSEYEADDAAHGQDAVTCDMRLGNK